MDRQESNRARLLRAVLRHRSMLLSYIHAIVNDFHLAEDVFQDVCVAIVESRKEAEIRDFAAFARGMARRKALAALRSLGRRSALNRRALEHLERTFQEADHTDYWEERKDALRRCLQKLPHHTREVLRLRYEKGNDCGVIARLLGRSRAAIHTLLSRARRFLADCVRQQLETA